MSEANGNSHTSPPTPNESNESELILTTGGVGEIKEALGRLYKKVNELEITQKAEREQDRAELKAWAQTNLIQTQLISKQTAVIELLTQELKNSENSRQQSELLSENLLQELALLKNQLQNMPKPSPQIESVELKGLKAEILSLRQALSSIPTKLDQINNNQTSIETQLLSLENQKIISQIEEGGWDYSSWRKAGQTALVFLILFFILSGIGSAIFPPRTPADTMAYLQEIWNRTGWANTKLQRIEKKLRTDQTH
jgi:small-conductance mechanosensitive channel